MREVQLNRGFVALVDDEDFDKVSALKWYESSGYGWHKGRKMYTSMHRFIMQAEKGVEVDHVDGNRLNNQRSNLRLCTPSQNRCNTLRKVGVSEYKGVSFDKVNQKWRAKIKVQGKHYSIGRYTTELEARDAYIAKAKELHGEFAKFFW